MFLSIEINVFLNIYYFKHSIFKNRMIFKNLLCAFLEETFSGCIWSRMWIGRIKEGRSPGRLMSVQMG